MRPEDFNISQDKLQFVDNTNRLHDQKLETKAVSYLHDAFNRFKRNRASITAGIIIIILLLFALIAPMVSRYSVAYNDAYYQFTLPKSKLFSALNISFWDGCKKKEDTENLFYYYYAIGLETGHNAVKNQSYTTYTALDKTNKEVTYYKYRLDSYQMNGVKFIQLSNDIYEKLQQYQNETGIQVIYPITDYDKRPASVVDNRDANYWYETKEGKGGKTVPVFGPNKELTNIYLEYKGQDDYHSIRIEGDTAQYEYAEIVQNGEYKVRVCYYEYYIFENTVLKKNRINEPYFLFGTTNSGQDIFTCLASGARFSFILAIVVASINLFVGAIYGAIEGYYGGKTDLIMERIVDILAGIPFMVVITLLKYHMTNTPQALILFLAFFVRGWIGMAATTRMQFYRFKNQEYVLAARTLGAKDGRIMFKHIFPNAIGTLITSCVLVIPGMIFSETSLSYLGIINLNNGKMTSVGTLLANAQQFLVSYPHMIFFPAVFISLLMLSFNLFGNGLRDAFNPSLRGTED